MCFPEICLHLMASLAIKCNLSLKQNQERRLTPQVCNRQLVQLYMSASFIYERGAIAYKSQEAQAFGLLLADLQKRVACPGQGKYGQVSAAGHQGCHHLLRLDINLHCSCVQGPPSSMSKKPFRMRRRRHGPLACSWQICWHGQTLGMRKAWQAQPCMASRLHA